MKLITKLTLIVPILITVIFALAAFFAFSQYKKTIKETIAQQQFLMVSILADEIDTKLLTAQQHLIAFAKTAPPDIMQHPEKAQAYLDNRSSLHVTVDNHLFLFKPTGKIYVESPYAPGRRGLDLSFCEYIINTLKTNKPYISDPYVSSQPNKHPVVMLAVPLFDRKGKITGILADSADLMEDNYLGRLSTVKIGKAGYLYLTATDRTLIMHPDKTRVLTKQAPGLNRLYDKAIEGFEGTDDTITSHGIKMVSSFKRLKTKNWILAANYPSVEAYRPIQVAERYFIMAAVIRITAIFFICYLVIKYFISPLELFTRHVEDLPQKTGEDRFLNIKTKDEIGTLSRTFNKMVAEIDKRSALERSAAKSLRESEERLTLALKAAGQGIYDLDLRTGEAIVSPEYAIMLGYDPAEFQETYAKWIERLHPDEKEAVSAVYREYVKGEIPEYRVEFRQHTKDGGWKWILSLGKIIERDANGNPLRMIGTNTDITDRKKAEQQIKQSLKEKEALLREIHHRVKNNMAVVSGLLSLEARKIKDADVRALFEKNQQRVRSMALVHEKLYQTKDLSSINLEGYIKSIISDIISLYRIDTSAITTEINIEGIELDLESAVPCGLIINELLTNAFKHGFPDDRSGVLSVDFRKTDDTYTLIIKDNGVGLPEGFDYNEESTLGLRLVKVLTEQIGGTLQIKSDKGTEAMVIFKTERD